MECAVCYCNNANCKLICGHSFCHQCVKDWYQKGAEQTCPMCRHKLYFKGMYKVTPVWEEERFYKQRDEAFAEAVDQIFEQSDSEAAESESESEDNESDDDSDDWETASEDDWPIKLELKSVDESVKQEDDDEDDDDESTWSFDMTDRRLFELADIQDQFNKFSDCGIDPSMFVQAYAEGAVIENDHGYYEDYENKNMLFVSKYSERPRSNSRIGNRLGPIGICVN